MRRATYLKVVRHSSSCTLCMPVLDRGERGLTPVEVVARIGRLVQEGEQHPVLGDEEAELNGTY